MSPTDMNVIEVQAINKNRTQSRAKVKAVAGFTLIEVLMALSISALVAVLAYGSVSAATNAVASTRLQAEQLDRLDTTWQLLAYDLQHIVAPPIEKSSGPHAETLGVQSLGLVGTVTTGSEADSAGKVLTVLRFVRRGWQNPLERQRSDLQRVVFEWYQGNLYRRHEPFYDGMSFTNSAMDPAEVNALSTSAQRPVPDTLKRYSRRRLLLTGVESIELQFLPASALNLSADQWQSAWPPAADSSALPVALKVTLTQRDTFKVERLFDIAAGFVR